MKLAVSTLPFQSWTLDKTLQFCQRAGYEAIEIRMDFHTWSDSQLPDKHYTDAMQRIAAKGLIVSDLGSGIVLNDYHDNDLKELLRAFQIAEVLHAKGVRIMLGNIRLSAGTLSHLNRKGILRWLREADRLAGEWGREVWIETHNEFSTGKSLHELFGEAGLLNTRVIWDIMHPLEQEEVPEETLWFLRERIAHIHIKDGLPWKDTNKLIWKYTRLGEGIVPIQRIIHLLESAGYDGFYSLEWESAWRKELAELDCDISAIRRYPEFMKKLK